MGRKKTVHTDPSLNDCEPCNLVRKKYADLIKEGYKQLVPKDKLADNDLLQLDKEGKLFACITNAKEYITLTKVGIVGANIILRKV